MAKCKVCGFEFELKAKDRYTVIKPMITAIKPMMLPEEELVPGVKLYDAFDCPVCGCQMAVNERYEAVQKCYYEDEQKCAEDQGDQNGINVGDFSMYFEEEMPVGVLRIIAPRKTNE